MSFDTCKDVWVFIESFQGQPKSVGLELLGQGRKLADGLKQKLCAIVIGKDVDAAVKESAAYGADIRSKHHFSRCYRKRKRLRLQDRGQPPHRPDRGLYRPQRRGRDWQCSLGETGFRR